MKILFALIALLVLTSSAQADDLSSTVRTTEPTGLSSTIRTTTPTGISSTVRTKPIPESVPDPMLDSAQPTPSSALSSTNMKTSDPMLNTTEGTPSSALSSTNMKTSDPMLNTTMGVPKSAISSTAPGIDPKLCNALTAATPRADVAYQPGVTASGKAVAPADIQTGDTQITMPRQVSFPITVQLTKVLHMDTSQYPVSALGQGTEAPLGVVTLEGNTVYYNGKPLSGEQQNNLAVLCMKQK